MTEIVWDFDAIKYTFAAACEKRTVNVLHKPTGRTKTFNNRTEFYGHWKKKEGGWLAEINSNRRPKGLQEFSVDEFEFEDKQEPEPLHFALQSVKNHIKNVTEKLNATSYYGYIGKGDSFRVEKSTILKYKGNRDNSLTPIHLEEIEKYLLKAHNAKVIKGIEADDAVVIDCTDNPTLVLVGEDKDYRGCNLNFFIPGVMESPEWMGGFGTLYINDKDIVKGSGYLWWLFQVASSDSSDNYAANSACPEKRWGEKSAYKALKDCKNEREAWEAVIAVYKKLYPQPKIITGWRGDEIEVDARYVLNENCVMSRMMTSDDYVFNLDEELDKFGVKL